MPWMVPPSWFARILYYLQRLHSPAHRSTGLANLKLAPIGWFSSVSLDRYPAAVAIPVLLLAVIQLMLVTGRL